MLTKSKTVIDYYVKISLSLLHSPPTLKKFYLLILIVREKKYKYNI